MCFTVITLKIIFGQYVLKQALAVGGGISGRHCIVTDCESVIVISGEFGIAINGEIYWNIHSGFCTPKFAAPNQGATICDSTLYSLC